MISDRVGAGISAIYDFPNQNFYALSNLILKF